MRYMILAVALAAAVPSASWAQGKLAVDTDGDGMVSREEAVRFGGVRFKFLDKNNNGALDRPEFEAAAKSQPQAGGKRERALDSRHTSRFEDVDKDGGGSISLEEFLAVQAERFKAADEDGDGKISVEQFRNLVWT